MSKIHVIVNPNIKERTKIADAVLQNDGYCPCKIKKEPDTKCPCKEFREQETGECHCGLYVKVEINDS